MWNLFKKKEPSLIQRAETANEFLTALGLPSHLESGRQIREVIALDLLSAEYDSVKGYKSAAFVNTVGEDTICRIKELLAQEGILTRKRVEKK